MFPFQSYHDRVFFNVLPLLLPVVVCWVSWTSTFNLDRAHLFPTFVHARAMFYVSLLLQSFHICCRPFSSFLYLRLLLTDCQCFCWCNFFWVFTFFNAFNFVYVCWKQSKVSNIRNVRVVSSRIRFQSSISSVLLSSFFGHIFYRCAVCLILMTLGVWSVLLLWLIPEIAVYQSMTLTVQL